MKNRKGVLNRQVGFTIVELLIVIVIIGILAAIVIVAYTGITSSAHDNAVKSNLSNLAKQLEMHKTLNTTGRYPVGVAELQALRDGVSLSKNSYLTGINNALYCYPADGSDYIFIARAASGNTFYISASNSSPTATTQVMTGGGSAVCSAMGIASPGWSWQYSTGGAWLSWVKG